MRTEQWSDKAGWRDAKRATRNEKKMFGLPRSAKPSELEDTIATWNPMKIWAPTSGLVLSIVVVYYSRLHFSVQIVSILILCVLCIQLVRQKWKIYLQFYRMSSSNFPAVIFFSTFIPMDINFSMKFKWFELEQGQLHGNPVTDGWGGAVKRMIPTEGQTRQGVELKVRNQESAWWLLTDFFELSVIVTNFYMILWWWAKKK